MRDYYDLLIENALLKSALMKQADQVMIEEAEKATKLPFLRRHPKLRQYWKLLKNPRLLYRWAKLHPVKATLYGGGALGTVGGLASLPFLLGGDQEAVEDFPAPSPSLYERALGFVGEHPYLTGGLAAGAIGVPLLAYLASRRRKKRK